MTEPHLPPADLPPAQVHPDVKAFLAAARAAGAQPFEALPPLQARKGYLERRFVVQNPPDAVAEKRDLTLPGPAGPIAVRLYRGLGTDAAAVLPCLVYFHGGGWVLGDLDTHDGLCCRLANEARCCVVSVDYRLAPEFPFPAAVDDCLAAFQQVALQAESLKIDANRLAIGGDSAGGNLAAVLALMSRDGNAPPAVCQLLLYPATDLVMSQDTGNDVITDGMTITPATMRYFIRHYAPDPASQHDWRASPARAASLAGTAPALVLTCGHDPLRDEGRAYAQRLEREGVPVTVLHLTDQTHGMLTLSKVLPCSADMLVFIGALLRDVFRLR